MRYTYKFRRILLSLCLTVGLLFVGWSTLTALAQDGAVSGQVTSPDGYPLPAGTVVQFFERGNESVYAEVQPNLDDGTFNLTVPNGRYWVLAVPAEGSGYAESRSRSVRVSDAARDVGELALRTAQIQGLVTAPDGTTAAAGTVTVYSSWGFPIRYVEAPSGTFAIGGLRAGEYRLEAWPTGDEPYGESERTNVTISSDGATQNVTLSLTTADLWGVTVDDQGNPVEDAIVYVRERGSNGNRDRSADISNENGVWALGGLSAGDYELSARAPFNRDGLVAMDSLSITLPSSDNPYTLTFITPSKVLTGVVRTDSDQPVSQAEVRAWGWSGRKTALTSQDGSYQLDLGPGRWVVTVRTTTDTTPSNWVFPHRPEFVRFNNSAEAETKQQDFTVLVADATVNGTVVMPDGSTPPFSVTVGIFNNEGIGQRDRVNPADGTFALQVPQGTYNVRVHARDRDYRGPSIEPITVDSATYDLGRITLEARDGGISGTVTTEDGSAAANVSVVAWNTDSDDHQQTRTDNNGQYSFSVSDGTWQIQPAPDSEDAYLYASEGQAVTVESGNSTASLDLNVQMADATIAGTFVDSAGNPVTDVSGWVRAGHVLSRSLNSGARIMSGTFTIDVMSGTYNVSARLRRDSNYISTGAQEVTVETGATANLNLTLQAKDAAIAGALVNPRDNNNPVTGVEAWVGAWYARNQASTSIDSNDGSYQLDVAAGIWHTAYSINRSANYVKIARSSNIPVEAGQTVSHNLPIIPKDGTISGTVLAPDGTPLNRAKVRIKGASGDIEGLRLSTRTGNDGSFELNVPNGSYKLGASAGASASGNDWLNPVELTVDVAENGTSSGHSLQFREPDATISGTLTVNNSSHNGRVHLSAWSDDGAFTRGRFRVESDGSQATGSYQIDVASGTTWHLVAVFEHGNEYWSTEVDLSVTGSQVTQNLTLDGPNLKPAPVAVTFDSSQAQQIDLADGTTIDIPADAMPVSGEVTVRIVPIATVAEQQDANVLGYGYAFLASDANGTLIEQQFNQDVTISFPYSESDLSTLGISENDLQPAYFSTTDNEWIIADTFAVDTDANQVEMAINHFTDFALISEGQTEAPTQDNLLYLPLVMGN